MHVERERNGSVAKLVNAVLRVKTARHADFEYIITKGADIADDVYRARLAVLQIDDFLFLFLDAVKLCGKLGNARVELVDFALIGRGGNLVAHALHFLLVFLFFGFDLLFFQRQGACVLQLPASFAHG